MSYPMVAFNPVVTSAWPHRWHRRLLTRLRVWLGKADSPDCRVRQIELATTDVIPFSVVRPAFGCLNAAPFRGHPAGHCMLDRAESFRDAADGPTATRLLILVRDRPWTQIYAPDGRWREVTGRAGSPLYESADFGMFEGMTEVDAR